MTKRILFLGYGYTARRLARLLAAEGRKRAATARDIEKAAALEIENIEPVLWTSAGIDRRAFDGVDAVLISTPPGADGCPAFAAAAETIAGRARDLKWVGYLSSNGVYGDHGGQWVAEHSELRPKSDRVRARIAAEAQWAGHGVEWAYPLAVFRLPGIYGPGRSALDAVREGRAQRIVKDGQVFNRMHIDDIAAALKASLDDPAAGDLFNLGDDEPSPPEDVVTFACELLGVEPPPFIAYETAELSEMARSFYADNKRVSNALMKAALGLRLRYPTYKEGLRAILEAEAEIT